MNTVIQVNQSASAFYVQIKLFNYERVEQSESILTIYVARRSHGPARPTKYM